MSFRQRTESVFAGCFVVIALLAATGATAETEECPTFFPDLRCDRSGRYEGFIPTMASPYIFEDPFITTNISAHGIWHDFP